VKFNQRSSHWEEEEEEEELREPLVINCQTHDSWSFSRAFIIHVSPRVSVSFRKIKRRESLETPCTP
jgi:hypothetical protein